MIILLLASAVLTVAGIIWTDTTFSKEILKKAKDGDPESQYQIGLCYQSGAGVKKNKKEAALWFLRASQQGHLEAKYILKISTRT